MLYYLKICNHTSLYDPTASNPFQISSKFVQQFSSEVMWTDKISPNMFISCKGCVTKISELGQFTSYSDAAEDKSIQTTCTQQKCLYIHGSYFEVQAMRQQGRVEYVLDLVPDCHCHDGDGCHPRSYNH